jgi:hypothetical protein
MTDSQQLFPQEIILAPDLPQCRYDEVANMISMPATHLLWFLVEAAEDGRVDPDRLRTRIRKSGHDWTEEQLLS